MCDENLLLLWQKAKPKQEKKSGYLARAWLSSSSACLFILTKNDHDHFRNPDIKIGKSRTNSFVAVIMMDL